MNGLLPISGPQSRQRILYCDREFWFSITIGSSGPNRFPRPRTGHGLGAPSECAPVTEQGPCCDMAIGVAACPSTRSDGLGRDRVLLCRDIARLAFVAKVFDVATQFGQEGKSLDFHREFFVATENSLSRPGIAASCRNSEHGFATRVGHDKDEQVKSEACDRRTAHVAARTTGILCTR